MSPSEISQFEQGKLTSELFDDLVSSVQEHGACWLDLSPPVSSSTPPCHAGRNKRDSRARHGRVIPGRLRLPARNPRNCRAPGDCGAPGLSPLLPDQRVGFTDVHLNRHFLACSEFKRACHGVGVVRNYREQNLRRLIGPMGALLPIAHGPKREMKMLHHAASALSAALGFFATMVKSERAAGSGSSRPCSQLRKVDSGMRRAFANSSCVIPSCLRSNWGGITGANPASSVSS